VIFVMGGGLIRRRRLAAGAVIIAAATMAVDAPAIASDTAQSPTGATARAPAAFNIPPQPLAAALEAYSKTCGVQVLYDSRLASGRRSAGVEGVLTPEAALTTLLAGTDLVVRYTAANDVVLLPASEDSIARGSFTAPIDAPVLALDTLRVDGSTKLGDAPDYRAYAGIVQADIQAFLRRREDTRSGSYNIGLRLWLDPSGAVLRSQVFRSTGNEQRDAAIARALRDVTISKPPPQQMPQPVSVMIVARAP
jgi:TonB family protein